MMNLSRGFALAMSGVVVLLSSSAATPATRADKEAWVASWASSPQTSEPDPDEPLTKLDGQTVRERVRLSVGGKMIRIRLSNEFGKSALTVGAASVGLPTNAESVRPVSLHQLTFGGRTRVSVPPGAPVLSDPISLPVRSGEELSISLFFPTRVETPTVHSLALRNAVVSGPGDYTRTPRIDPVGKSTSSIAVTAVLVPNTQSKRLVVAFGDSITDGAASTTDRDQSWPAQFAQRVTNKKIELAIVNAGIAGNQLGHEGFGTSGLARFDRDVLSLPGVTHVILLEGINDIAAPGVKIGARYFAPPGEVRTADEVIANYRQLVTRAHDHGIKVIGATLTPFAGTTVPGFYSPEKEAIRQTVNAWVRGAREFDGVIDFDATLRDPASPGRLNPRFASRDRLHPNDLGYATMANAIDLTLFH
ncbi:SGNH/GDSL hydrolase family protein [Sphingomonas faeni]|uniref:SGNH/GDSL hydrolase family protein n=1 Tax=Sphingomonas faeni TaxID=185950 RepID=UPI00241338AE|nr:SGNH/GDSL hydrolase family protein [Sphingomonas faeni]